MQEYFFLRNKVAGEVGLIAGFRTGGRLLISGVTRWLNIFADAPKMT
jgi:hypothetical protein